MTAAVAAAAGIAAYGLRKAPSSGGSNGVAHKSARNRDEDEEYEDDANDGNGDDGGSSRGESMLQTVGLGLRSLMPLVEEAADAAGKWTAKNAPDIVRDQLVPRFIEAFNDAS